MAKPRSLFVLAVTFALSACAQAPASTPSPAATTQPSTAVASTAGTGVLDLVRQSGQLVTGTSDSPPISATDPVTGEGTWFTADVLRAFLTSQGLPSKVMSLAMPFSSLVPALQSSRIDMIGDSIFFTEERDKTLDFTRTVIYNPEVLDVPKGNPNNLHTLADLCGHDAGSYLGTTYLDMLKTASEACPSGTPINVHEYPTIDKVFADLSAGRLDGAVVDASLSTYALKQNPSLNFELVSDYVPQDIESTAGRFAVRQGDTAFTTAFDAAYTQMLNDGTVDKLLTDSGLMPISLFKPKP
jgi:polar amino acid transport system substrate-binding protein